MKFDNEVVFLVDWKLSDIFFVEGIVVWMKLEIRNIFLLNLIFNFFYKELNWYCWNISIVSMVIMCDNNILVVIFKDFIYFFIENDCYIVCLWVID